MSNNKQKKESIISRLKSSVGNFGDEIMYSGEVIKRSINDTSFEDWKESKSKLKKDKIKKPIKRMFTTDEVLEKELGKGTNRFEAIDDIISLVETVPKNLNSFFNGIEYLGQEAVDAACEETGKFVSNKLQKVCDNATNYLHDRYGSALLLASKLEIIKNPPTSPDKMVTWAVDYIDQHKWTQIIKLILDFAIELPPRINRLTAALSKIASYTPPSIDIDISLDKFQVTPPSVSIDKIIG